MHSVSCYGDEAKVYSIGKGGDIVSFEVCGGPHVCCREFWLEVASDSKSPKKNSIRLNSSNQAVLR